MKRYIWLLLFAMASCTQNKPEKQQENNGAVLNNFTVKTFANDSTLKGYGYDILMDGKIMVHQPNIPAVMGNRGFATEEDAKKTAALVVHKLQNNIMPPSLNIAELDSMGIK